MWAEQFEEEDIPIAEFENIGLSKDGLITLGDDDLKALLSGGRTDLIHLMNLTNGEQRIPDLEAKLSLHRNEEGKLDLLIHPIYRKERVPDFLPDEDAVKLADGDSSSFYKTVEVNGKKKNVIVEFDHDTKEFIITDGEQILVPDFVNGDELTPEQKRQFKKGETIEMPEGTKLRYSATTAQGIRSNKARLITSLVMNGGLSFLLYTGIKALSKKEPKVSQEYSKGYYQALEDLNVRKVKERMGGRAR
jgi:hypothetical protein